MRYNVHVTGTRFIGVDLAWREGSADLVANETGVAVIDADGRVLDAGWKRGAGQTIAWVDSAAADGDAVMFADAPLVVRNETGQRLCEKQVGQRYWRWKVSANTTNTGSPRLAGVQFLRLAGLSGWRYSDGSGGPPRAGRIISETYPYATLAGAAELGYDTERPRYKRKPRRLRAAQWRDRARCYLRHADQPARAARAARRRRPAAPAPLPSGHQGAGRAAVTGHRLRV
jgi:predicted RNase H-like nuclease